MAGIGQSASIGAPWRLRNRSATSGCVGFATRQQDVAELLDPACRAQPLHRRIVADKTRDAGKRLQVVAARVLRRQQQEHKVYGLLVRGLEIDWGNEFRKGTENAL